MKKKRKPTKRITNSENDTSKGPFLAVAALCDQVLEEKGSNVVSLIRLIDTCELDIATDAPAHIKPLISVKVTGLVAFKSGDFKGKKDIFIKLINPMGIQMGTAARSPALFEGGEHGVNIILRLALQTSEAGLFWFEIEMDGRLVTRIPLKVTITRKQNPDGEQDESLMSAGHSD